MTAFGLKVPGVLLLFSHFEEKSQPAMPKLYLLIAIPFFVLTARSQETLTGSLPYDGISRDYRLYVPAGYTGQEEVPLVFNLHGFGSNAFEQQVYAAMGAVADTANFLICYPNGVGNAWNVGWSFGSTADDVGFLSALLDELLANYAVDSTRVYACGMSNGGFMSYVLACELNDRIAAVASVTGSMAPNYAPACQPGRPVPVMQIHGTADGTVPYDGEPLINIAIDSLLAFWAGNNGCSGPPDTTDVPDIAPNDGCTAQRIDYNNCTDPGALVFFRVQDGGHTWPGSPIPIGVTNQDFDASTEIWRFFRQYGLGPTTSLATIAQMPGVRLFPNPAQDRVQLEQSPEQPYSSYRLFSAQGRQVSEGVLAGSRTTLSLPGLPPGLYLLRLEGRAGSCVKRILKR